MQADRNPAKPLWRAVLLAVLALTLSASVCGVYAYGGAGPEAFFRSRVPPRAPVVDPLSIKRVHVVFMNHLDVGFTLMSGPVLTQYFYTHFPRAIDTANAMRANGSAERYVYTSHPFLLSLFVNCPAELLAPLNVRCPNDTERAAVVRALQLGDITYHAFAFNAEPELLTEFWTTLGLSMAQVLDQTLPSEPKVSMSQRDVPGMTRAIIPTLVEAGIMAITVGVNGGSAPPGMPSAFLWRDTESNTEVICMYHPGGYGGTELSDAVLVQGFDEALVFAFKGDNQGPHSQLEALAVYAQLRAEFFNAEVQASTIDAFVLKLHASRAVLPVYDCEIGDTWIHGVASDPWKLAAFRAVERFIGASAAPAIARAEAEDARLVRLRDQSGRVRSSAPAVRRGTGKPGPRARALVQHVHDSGMWDAVRMLIKVSEHTWGVDVKVYLDDWVNWTNEQLRANRNRSNFQFMENAWREQRAYIVQGLAALDPKVRDAIVADLASVRPPPFDPIQAGYSKISWQNDIDCGSVVVNFASNGGLQKLYDKLKGRQWASAASNLGVFVYQSFTEDDFMAFLTQYMNASPPPDWATKDFGKPGLGTAQVKHQTVSGKLQALYRRDDSATRATLLAAQVLVPAPLVSEYGAPQTVWLLYSIPKAGGSIGVTMQWTNKTTTRIPEALWLSMNPVCADGSAGAWTYTKMGRPVDPSNVCVNGSFHMHGVESVSYACASGATLRVTPIDTALANLGPAMQPTPFPTPFAVPAAANAAMHFNAYNNIWGTNYIMWYPFDAADSTNAFRFRIDLV